MSRYRIGEVEIDAEARTVSRGGEPIALEPRAFDLLVYLIRHRDRAVTKDELIERVWDERIVSDGALTQAIVKIRRVFGGDTQAVISTVSRVGYRFVGTLDSDTPLRRRPGPWLAAAALLLIGLLLVLIRPWERAAAPPAPNSIAVLPLLDLSPDQSLRYFGDGLADELLAELARLPDLNVVARTSSFALRGRDLDVREIGATLGAASVLEGSLRIEDGRIRLTAQLIETENGTHLWSESYDRDFVQVLDIQRELATAIAAELHARVTDPAGRSLLGRPPANVNAFDAYLKGRHLWHSRDQAALQQAIALFQDAIRADPGFARAHEALASTYVVLPSWASVPRSEFEALAFSAAREALRLDDRLGEARAILATQAAAERDWLRARQLHEEAIEREPSNPTLLHWYAAFLMRVGQAEGAVAPAQRAVTLDPLSPMTHTVRAWAALLTDDPARAGEHANQAVELGIQASWVIAAAAAARRGDRAGAAELLRKLPNAPGSIAACADALTGSNPDAAARQLIADPRRDELALIYRTLCLGLLGRAEDAVALHATEEDWGMAAALLWLPQLAAARAAPAYQALTERQGLTEYWQRTGPPKRESAIR